LGGSGSVRQGFGSGGETAAVWTRGDFGLRGCERERDVEMETSGTNAKRGSAPETAYGHTAGEKL
jgi:hypothetical protein